MTFWFWLLVVVAVIFLFLSTENEWGGWATINITATLLLLNFVFGIPIFDWIIEHPFWLVIGIVLYFVIGTV